MDMGIVQNNPKTWNSLNLEKTKETSRGETEVSGLWEPGSLVRWGHDRTMVLRAQGVWETELGRLFSGSSFVGLPGCWVQGEVVQGEEQAFILGVSSVGDERVTKVDRVKTS